MQGKRRHLSGVGAMLVAALLAACSTQLESDLSHADGVCRDRDWPTKTALVSCLAAQERPVWAKDEPATLDVYDSYAARRRALAEALDQKKLTSDQYDDKLDELNRRAGAALKQRRRQEAGAAKP